MKRPFSSFSLYEQHDQQPGGGGSCGNCKECIEKEQERERMRYHNNYDYSLENGNGETMQASSTKGKGRLEFVNNSGNNEIKDQTRKNNPTSTTTNSVFRNPNHNFSTPYTTSAANPLFTNTNLKRNPSFQYNDDPMLISNISKEEKLPFELVSTSSSSISPHTQSNNMGILAAKEDENENENGGWDLGEDGDEIDKDDLD
ncbi:3678_t:CDS:2 [Ambispora gerdemannii]|uniref:3678_t:CDS:1 n=1 Tax=Ambispora gerdemannii TaxID=144530 RepID=A0A9N9FJR8_9GLOM|nr:3678_t:CDS:2 [Ambispora gerdemannii]